MRFTSSHRFTVSVVILSLARVARALLSPRLRGSACLLFWLVFGATLGTIPALAGANTQKLPPHANIKSVAIISAVGETFMFEHVKNAPFEWIGPPETSFLEISDWGLDDLVTRDATAVLSKRYRVVPVKYVDADFDTWTWPSLVRCIRELPLPDEDVDAYIVILRDWRSDTIGNSAHQVAGSGLYRQDLQNGARLGVFASYRIAVIDARSYAVVASRPVLTADGSLPWTSVAPAIWPQTQNDLADAQKEMLKAGLVKLIDQTLSPALRDVTDAP